jgi:hypothetical protein
MKRHGGNLREICRAFRSVGAAFGEPIMELVNGTFGVRAAGSPCFQPGAAAINLGIRNFKGL